MGLTVCNCTGCSFCGARCPRLVSGGRCEGCHAERRREADRRRPNSTERGYDHRWARFAKAYLADHPTCEETGCSEPATDVDHLDGRGPLGPRGFDRTNCLARCHPHHSQRTARDQPGGWNR